MRLFMRGLDDAVVSATFLERWFKVGMGMIEKKKD